MYYFDVSGSGIWLKIARFGGFNPDPLIRREGSNDPIKIPKSSCDFIWHLIKGSLMLLVSILVILGTVMATAIFLIWMGLPAVAGNLVNNMGSWVILYVIGLITYTLLALFAAAWVLAWACMVMYPVYHTVRALPWFVTHNKLCENIRDYTDGICKPVRIVD